MCCMYRNRNDYSLTQWYILPPPSKCFGSLREKCENAADRAHRSLSLLTFICQICNNFSSSADGPSSRPPPEGRLRFGLWPQLQDQLKTISISSTAHQSIQHRANCRVKVTSEVSLQYELLWNHKGSPGGTPLRVQTGPCVRLHWSHEANQQCSRSCFPTQRIK